MIRLPPSMKWTQNFIIAVGTTSNAGGMPSQNSVFISREIRWRVDRNVIIDLTMIASMTLQMILVNDGTRTIAKSILKGRER